MELAYFERPTVKLLSKEPISRLVSFSAVGRLRPSSASSRSSSRPSVGEHHCGPDKLPIDEPPWSIRSLDLKYHTTSTSEAARTADQRGPHSRRCVGSDFPGAVAAIGHAPSRPVGAPLAR